METGLIVQGVTDEDNSKIGKWLKGVTDYHAEWNREGYWFFEEKESSYDELELALDENFYSLNIDARYEGVFLN